MINSCKKIFSLLQWFYHEFHFLVFVFVLFLSLSWKVVLSSCSHFCLCSCLVLVSVMRNHAFILISYLHCHLVLTSCLCFEKLFCLDISFSSWEICLHLDILFILKSWFCFDILFILKNCLCLNILSVLKSLSLSLLLLSILVLVLILVSFLRSQEFQSYEKSYCHNNSLVVQKQHSQSYTSEFWSYDSSSGSCQTISMLALSVLCSLSVCCIRQLTCSLDSYSLSSWYNILLSILYLVWSNRACQESLSWCWNSI